MKMSVLFAQVLIVLCHLSDAVAAQPPVERISRALLAFAGIVLLVAEFLEHRRKSPAKPKDSNETSDDARRWPLL